MTSHCGKARARDLHPRPHVVLWLASDADRVPDHVRRLLEVADDRLISAVSAMEISLKTRTGKFPHGQAVIDAWPRIVDEFMAAELPLSVRHMMRAGSLEWSHRDPFDRMLVAQARFEGVPLVTTDRRIVEYSGVETLSW